MQRAVILAFLAAACGSGEKYPRDGILRLNALQAVGTHNSYHREPAMPFDDSHRYSHPALDVQLGELGVRQLELDLHLTVGGWFEVFHLPGGVDSETTCLRFTECLERVRSFSDAHRDHLPLLIWLEPKDEDLDWADQRYQPILDRYDDLEREIASVFTRDRLIIPDDVRTTHDTLAEAITTDGWPTLGVARGKIMFAMLDEENHRAHYTAGAPNLAGRTLFVATSSASDPFAAMFKINDPQSSEIPELVARNFLVTTGADSADENDASNTVSFEAALASGAHFSSSDFVAPRAGYRAQIPGGTTARCNPQIATAACSPQDLESLDR